MATSVRFRAICVIQTPLGKAVIIVKKNASLAEPFAQNTILLPEILNHLLLLSRHPAGTNHRQQLPWSHSHPPSVPVQSANLGYPQSSHRAASL